MIVALLLFVYFNDGHCTLLELDLELEISPVCCSRTGTFSQQPQTGGI